MNWTWEPVDAGRANRALKVKVSSLELSSDDPCATFIGSSGTEYTCTLDDCTCPDFAINERKGNRQPCKHIIRLAMELGILNKEGRTAGQQLEKDISDLEQKLAIYAWHYYVLDVPDVSDKEYDNLKSEYLNLIKSVSNMRGGV